MTLLNVLNYNALHFLGKTKTQILELLETAILCNSNRNDHLQTLIASKICWYSNISPLQFIPFGLVIQGNVQLVLQWGYQMAFLHAWRLSLQTMYFLFPLWLLSSIFQSSFLYILIVNQERITEHIIMAHVQCSTHINVHMIGSLQVMFAANYRYLLVFAFQMFPCTRAVL